jgi:site-specific recombinase XerC
MQGYRFVFPDPYTRANGDKVNRFRFKRPGFPSATTTAALDSEEFRLWYHQLTATTANAEPTPTPGRPVTLQPGDTGKGKSLDWLLAVYYGAPEYNKLGARDDHNRDQRRRYLGAFAEARTRGGRRFGGSPFEDFTKQDIELYLDKVKATGRSPGNKGRKGGKSVRDSHLAAIRVLFNFAIERGLTKLRNPAATIKRTYKSDGHTPWDDNDRAKFRACWAVGTMPRLAFELLLATGVRRSDLHLLSWDMVGRDGVLRTTEIKGSGSEANDHDAKPFVFDLGDYPELRTMIKATATAQAEATGVVPFKGGAWLTNTRGRQFGYGNLGARWKEWTLAAGVDPDRTLHGMRAGFAVKMLEVTGDLSAVSDALGHTNLTTTQIYLRGRNRSASAKRGRLALRDAIKGVA